MTAASAPGPNGVYLTAVEEGSLVFVAGMTPRLNGELRFRGTVGRELTLDEACEAARIAMTNAVTAAQAALSPGRRLVRALRCAVYIVVDDMSQLRPVADAASTRLVELLGDGALGVRSAIGVAVLPGGSPVEVELTFSTVRHEADGHPSENGGDEEASTAAG